MKPTLAPVGLACIGGLLGTTVDVLALVALVERGVPVALAAFLGAAAGAAGCFVANKYVAFRDRSPLSLQQVGAFGLVAVGTALLTAAAMHVVADGLGAPYLVAKAACAALVFAAWSYPAQRRLVFPPAAARDLDLELELDPSRSLA